MSNIVNEHLTSEEFLAGAVGDNISFTPPTRKGKLGEEGIIIELTSELGITRGNIERLHHLLQEDVSDKIKETEKEYELYLDMRVDGFGVYRVGKIYLTMDKYRKIMESMRQYNVKIYYMDKVDGEVEKTLVTKEDLYSTLSLDTHKQSAISSYI